MNAGLAVITETWLADGQALEDDLQDLEEGAGIKMILCNRQARENGVAHGGVGLAYKTDLCKFDRLDFPNPDCFEVVAALGTVPGHSRKMAVVGMYIPPNYNATRGQACLDHVADVVLTIKRKYHQPYIVVAGDFNQWPIDQALADYPDLVEAPVGPTRGRRSIDRIFVSGGQDDEVVEAGTLNPLETDDSSRKSDHRIAYAQLKLRRSSAFEWISYSYRYFSPEAEKLFGDWIVHHKWEGVLAASTSNEKADLYQAQIMDAIDRFFPLVTTRRKSTDPPWINGTVRWKIAKRKRLYKLEGRSDRWKAMKKETDNLIKKRRSVYRSVQLANLTDRDAQRSFFKNIKAYKTGDRPKVFDVRTLCPGKTDGEVAEELAAYFNRISDEFAGLSPADIPLTKSRSLPTLETYEVAARIRRFRKPRSMVRGDVFPSLVTRYADFFAIPLRSIYNEITRSKVWPIAWKLESVTVIPKTTCPADFSGLRNISCTLLASKMYESYVLAWALEEVSLKKNQYGGTRGCGTAHMLINIYQSICENLEDYRACTVLTAIDYAKAFNRMSYQYCLSSLAKMGLSSPLLSLIASFLTNRRMAVRVGSTWSTERPVNGGCPQGSILGVFLFNSTINDLEDDYMGRSHHEVSTPLRDGRPPQPPTPPLAPPDPPAEEVYRLGPDQSDPASPSAGGFFSSTPTREPTPDDPDISDVQVGVVLDDGVPALRRMRNLGRPQQAAGPAVAVLPVLDEPNLQTQACLLYTSPSPRDRQKSRMPSSA